MINNIDWNTLRSLDGSQRTAFEELCCQLAAYEPTPIGSQFLRVGAPDAGVECYWLLPQGDEQGWQAKFFTSPPKTKQWEEVDESVKTALEKHPRLVKYTVCFPLDRQDPRRDGEQWFMDHWNRQVEKWKRWAEARGMAVEFEYWGEHELLTRLSLEEHRGRFFFWFHQELFSTRWFHERLDEAIVDAGPRYTPELNVDLPIARLFDGLGRTAAFFERLNALITDVKLAYRAIISFSRESAEEEYRSLKHVMQGIATLTQFNQQSADFIDWARMQQAIAAAYTETSNWAQKVERARRERAQTDSEKEQTAQQETRSAALVSDLYQLMRALRALQASIQNDEAGLANVAALLLLGDAGTGKTHLFCDVARHRLRQGQPTILLLGEKFRENEPWTQMRDILGLSCDRDQFLGALNAAGEAHQQRTLLLIDALNEGRGKELWINYLAGMLTTLKRYPWIGIALSVRTSYEKAIIPEGLVPARLIRAVHEGFAEREYEATKTYFDFYRIERPSIPLLLPEFQNPLFLKLFCQGLRAGNYTRIPEGLEGISAIFAFFLDNLNNKLTKLLELDLNPHIPYVRRAVMALTEALAEKQVSWLPHEEAQAIVDQVAPPKSYERSMFRRLITEGVLAEDHFLVSGANGDHSHMVEGIRFAYERFSDHLIVQYLLNKHLDPDQLLTAFEQESPLGQLFSTVRAQRLNRGLIEALSIQLPERIGKELCELVSAAANDEVIRAGLVESLLWRNPASITKQTLQCINKHALRYIETNQQFLSVLLTVAMNPRHPLNADSLHKNLRGLTMAERDAWWSIFLYDQYDSGLHSPVNRLIDWAWKAEERDRIDDEPLRLACTALCWFLTTSHRFLRDRATKALVRLLEKRLSVLRRLLAAFGEVNDPYVVERLYAVAYGCAMRCTDHTALAALAQEVYDRVFRDGQPPSNILLRDYARGVIERALALHLDISVQPEKIRPPYHNTWPEDFPSEAEVEQLLGAIEREGKEMSPQERGRFELYFSMMGWGDFARYVLGVDSPSAKWSSRRLTDSAEPSRRERANRFLAYLTGAQKRAVERFRTAYAREVQRQWLEDWNRLFQEEDEDDVQQEEQTTTVQVPIQQPELSLEEEEVRMYRILGKRKAALFESEYLPWFEEQDEPEEQFDRTLLQRWIVRRVFELGWNIERFGEFDGRVKRNDDRSPDKPERIGKKYQWIAYYDILSRMTDTFVFRDGYGDEDAIERPYEGPWQMSPVRNIDPSFLLENTRASKGVAYLNTINWWYRSSPRWDLELNDRLWLLKADVLPDPRLLIEVTRPMDHSVWWTLYGHYPWRQPQRPEDKGNGPQGREIWYFLETCLVKRKDAKQMFTWAKRHDFSVDHLPQLPDWDDVYLGELYWSPCYQYFYDPVRGFREWTRGDDGKYPAPIMLTTESYNWSRQYDCSVDESLRCTVPSKFLVDGIKLLWNGVEGEYITADGELTAFDPSIHEEGPSVLLIRKDTFLTFLRANDLALLWTIRGEKNAYGNGDWPDSFEGRFNISGAYWYTEQDALQGNLSQKDSSS